MKTILVDAVNTTIVKSADGTYQKFDELFTLLETYPNPKMIVTNAHDEQMKEFGLDDIPYPVFTMKHNPDKPDPVYFKTLLEQKKLEVSNVIYFEHNPEAVVSAQSIGITAYHYDKNTQDLLALKKFLDKNLEYRSNICNPHYSLRKL